MVQDGRASRINASACASGGVCVAGSSPGNAWPRSAVRIGTGLHRFTRTAVWSISAVLIVAGVSLQIIGHRLFERRQPALLDNPPHLLLGPMFVMAKLFIALGFRHDLALIIDPVPQTAALGTTFYADARNGETHPNS
jgi:hypothetical protein